MLTLNLPEDIENRLELLSLHTGQSKQFYAWEAILEYLNEVEERYMPTNLIAEESNNIDKRECPDEVIENRKD